MLPSQLKQVSDKYHKEELVRQKVQMKEKVQEAKYKIDNLTESHRADLFDNALKGMYHYKLYSQENCKEMKQLAKSLNNYSGFSYIREKVENEVNCNIDEDYRCNLLMGWSQNK